MTVFDEKKRPLLRMMTGGLLGVAGFLLLGWITQPGAFFGGGWDFDFTFCYNSNVPEALGAALGFDTTGVDFAMTALFLVIAPALDGVKLKEHVKA